VLGGNDKVKGVKVAEISLVTTENSGMRTPESRAKRLGVGI